MHICQVSNVEKSRSNGGLNRVIPYSLRRWVLDRNANFANLTNSSRICLEKIIPIPKTDVTSGKEIFNKNIVECSCEKKANKKDAVMIHIIKKPERKIAKKLPTDRERCVILFFIRNPLYE